MSSVLEDSRRKLPDPVSAVRRFAPTRLWQDADACSPTPFTVSKEKSTRLELRKTKMQRCTPNCLTVSHCLWVISLYPSFIKSVAWRTGTQTQNFTEVTNRLPKSSPFHNTEVDSLATSTCALSDWKGIPLVKRRDFELDAKGESTPNCAELEKRANSKAGNCPGNSAFINETERKSHV